MRLRGQLSACGSARMPDNRHRKRGQGQRLVALLPLHSLILGNVLGTPL